MVSGGCVGKPDRCTFFWVYNRSIMEDWRTYLNGDPLPWLLEAENPSVRRWTLLDVLDRPADDPEVCAAGTAVAQQPLVRELFARQHPEGYWGDDETKPHTAQGAVGVLTLLYMLGVAPDERTAAGCDSFLNFCQHASGGFSMTKTLRSGIFPCTTGEHLPFLVYFGLADDPRVQAAFAFLIADMAVGRCSRLRALPASGLPVGRHRRAQGSCCAAAGTAIVPVSTRGAAPGRCAAGRPL